MRRKNFGGFADKLLQSVEVSLQFGTLCGGKPIFACGRRIGLMEADKSYLKSEQ
jgi:hypothetical protein